MNRERNSKGQFIKEERPPDFTPFDKIGEELERLNRADPPGPGIYSDYISGMLFGVGHNQDKQDDLEEAWTSN